MSIFDQCEVQSKEFYAFAVENLASNSDILEKLWVSGGITPLLNLAQSKNIHFRCLGLAFLRRLALNAKNRERLFHSGILTVLSDTGNFTNLEVQREVASCLNNLSLSCEHRIETTNSPTLVDPYHEWHQ